VENSQGNKANAIIEITGYNKDKAEKKWYTQQNRIPAVNDVREKYGYQPWHFFEIANEIKDVKNQLIPIIESLEPELETEGRFATPSDQIPKSAEFPHLPQGAELLCCIPKKSIGIR
jgi:type III restriction enzyme